MKKEDMAELTQNEVEEIIGNIFKSIMQKETKPEKRDIKVKSKTKPMEQQKKSTLYYNFLFNEENGKIKVYNTCWINNTEVTLVATDLTLDQANEILIKMGYKPYKVVVEPKYLRFKSVSEILEKGSLSTVNGNAYINQQLIGKAEEVIGLLTSVKNNHTILNMTDKAVVIDNDGKKIEIPLILKDIIYTLSK